jgi:hypothetical protein
MDQFYDCCCCAHVDVFWKRHDSVSEVRAELDGRDQLVDVSSSGDVSPCKDDIELMSRTARGDIVLDLKSERMLEEAAGIDENLACTTVHIPSCAPPDADENSMLGSATDEVSGFADHSRHDVDTSREDDVRAVPYVSAALGPVMELSVVAFSCRFFVMHKNGTNLISEVLNTQECKAFHGCANLQSVVYTKPLLKSFGGDNSTIFATCYFPVARSQLQFKRWFSGCKSGALSVGNMSNGSLSRGASVVSHSSNSSRPKWSREFDDLCSETSSNVQQVTLVEFSILSPEVSTPQPQAEAGSAAIVCIVDMAASAKSVEDDLRDMVLRLVEIGRVPQSRRPARFVVCLNSQSPNRSPETVSVLEAWLERYSFTVETSLHCPVFCQGSDSSEIHKIFGDLSAKLQVAWSAAPERTVEMQMSSSRKTTTGLTSSPLPESLGVSSKQRDSSLAKPARASWIFSKEFPKSGLPKKW